MKETKEHPQSKETPVTRVSLANILVATDFSPCAENALDYALIIARRFDSRIYLAHVLTPDAYAFVPPEAATVTHGALRQASEQKLADILISGRLREAPHEVVLEEGFLWPTIEKLIQKYEIDLIVVGTHGAKKFEKLLLGSGAEEIFRRAACPVMTVGPRFAGEPARTAEWKNILFATDLEQTPERAAAYAFSLAQEYQAHLTLLHVATRHGTASDRELAAKREAVLQRLQELVPAGSALWCDPEMAVSFGSAPEEIMNMARARNVDLIVMGARATGGGLGTHNPFATTYRVVCEASCPVLTVKS
jgi:nucleotide-binding universal stress UspA family protein